MGVIFQGLRLKLLGVLPNDLFFIKKFGNVLTDIPDLSQNIRLGIIIVVSVHMTVLEYLLFCVQSVVWQLDQDYFFQPTVRKKELDEKLSQSRLNWVMVSTPASYAEDSGFDPGMSEEWKTIYEDNFRCALSR